MEFPSELKYTKDHEWVLIESTNRARIGVTEYAIEQLGDIVHIDFPEPGSQFESGGPFGTIESTKTVSDLYMPLAGKITRVNDTVAKTPESLQNQAYGDGWLVEMEFTGTAADSDLMDASQYQSYITELED